MLITAIFALGQLGSIDTALPAADSGHIPPGCMASMMATGQWAHPNFMKPEKLKVRRSERWALGRGQHSSVIAID